MDLPLELLIERTIGTNARCGEGFFVTERQLRWQQVGLAGQLRACGPAHLSTGRGGAPAVVICILSAWCICLFVICSPLGKMRDMPAEEG